MDWFVYSGIFSAGTCVGILLMLYLEKWSDERERQDAAHAAAEARAASKLKRSQSAKAAAQNRKARAAEPAEAGVIGLTSEVTATSLGYVGGELGSDTLTTAVDESLYGKKASDGLAH